MLQKAMFMLFSFGVYFKRFFLSSEMLETLHTIFSRHFSKMLNNVFDLFYEM